MYLKIFLIAKFAMRYIHQFYLSIYRLHCLDLPVYILVSIFLSILSSSIFVLKIVSKYISKF
jgi:hypothetical protein